jgi:hypothetical protein
MAEQGLSVVPTMSSKVRITDISFAPPLGFVIIVVAVYHLEASKNITKRNTFSLSL